MSNMSYCRFRNTLGDMRDCRDSLHDEVESYEEALARHYLVEMCREIVASIDEDDFPKPDRKDWEDAA